MKRWFMVLFMILVCLISAVTAPERRAQASETDDDRTGHSAGTGQIRLHFEAEGRIAAGGEVRLFQAAETSDAPGGYSYCRAFEDCGIDIGQSLLMQNEDYADQLAAYARTLDDSGRIGIVDEEGNLCFDELDAGIYLLIQSKAADGFTRMRPFVIVVADNEIVEAAPKLMPIREQESESAGQTEEERVPESLPEEEPPGLPVTGQLQWPIPVLIGTGLILLISGCIKKKAAEKQVIMKRKQIKTN